jgi:DnaK suppressor protein
VGDDRRGFPRDETAFLQRGGEACGVSHYGSSNPMPDNASPEDGLDLAFFRRMLEERRAQLLADDALGREAAGTVELDQTRQGRLSRMDALQQQAMAAETQRRRMLELKRIAGALRRIQEGEYGYCLSCGEDIARARLEFDPAATMCVTCAEADISDH